LERHPLGPLLRKATQKDPEARNVTAQGLLLELEACARERWPGTAPWLGSGTAEEQGLIDTLVTRPGAERRQLTAVCCGLTLAGLEEGEDIEEADQLHRSLYVALAEIARRFDAHIGGVLAERMLMFLGYPTARENDARRAARMALEMVAEMERRAAELKEKQGPSLEARVGIHTGLVLSQEGRANGGVERSVLVGPVPSVASRLEGLASPGVILISAQTAKLLKDSFELLPAREARVGTWSMQSFQLGGELRTSAPGQVMPLFGRSWESELLRQRWRQVQAGMGQCILIAGEPGIGKSRLVQELVQETRDTPHTFLECRCSPEWSNSTLRPVVDLLERMLGLDRGSTVEQAIAALEELLSKYNTVLAETLPLLASLLSLKGTSSRYPLPAMSPQRQQEETFQALLGLLFEMAERQPVLLVVEDLHWADPTTLEWLSALMKEVAGARLYAVLTARPDFTPPWPSSQVLQVQLGRLERPQVQEMVRLLTRESPLPSEMVERMVERADGVPLFIEELTRMVVESMQQRGDTPRKVGALEIPSTLRDSLMARLDRLGQVKATAQLASALGREFSYELLVAASSLDEAVLKKDLEVLVSADLIHRRRGVRSPGYAFKHALIRDTAYESMPKSMRRQMHARIAAALELRFPELAQQRPDVLARHHAAAEQKQEALGYAYKAALAALMRSANHEALGHATEALGWLGVVEDSRERARLELDLNGVIIPALMYSQRWSDKTIKALVDRSQELIDLLGDNLHVVPILWALIFYYHTRAQRQQARTLSERLLSMNGLSQDADHQVAVLPLLGDCYWCEARHEEARECFTRTLALYNAERHLGYVHIYGLEPRVYAEIGLGEVLWIQGYPDEARKRIQSAHVHARELNHAGTLAFATIWHAVTYLRWEEYEAFAKVCEETLELTIRQRLISPREYWHALRGFAVRDLEELNRSLMAIEEQGSLLGLAFYKSLAAQVESELGLHDSALERLEGALRSAQAAGELYYIPELLRIRGNCLLSREPGGAAGEASLREAISLAREQDAKMWELRASISLCQLLLERGDKEEAREMLAPLYARFTEGYNAPDLIRTRALLEKLSD
jgi:TOMM system kinase/cyclase fusion protein